MRETDGGEMRRSRGNEGGGGCRVRFARGWKRRSGENERRTVQVIDGESCVGDG
jgi:hypothetical protein